MTTIRWRAFLVFLFLIACAGLTPQAARAATCAFTAATTVAFGSYNVYGAAVDSNGSVSINCSSGSSTERPVLTINYGDSTNTYHPRKMKCVTTSACGTSYSTDELSYNLYTSAALTSIWGNPALDATTSSLELPNGCCTTGTTYTATIYGQLPAAVAGTLNDVAVGNYSDSLTITMTF